MKKIGEGMVSEAFLDNGRVLLVGKRPDAFKIYTELKANLDFFEGKIKSLKIPSNAKIIAPGDEHPLGAITFGYVPGTPLNERIKSCTVEQKKAIGKKLVEFILEMQRVKTNPEIHNKANELERNFNKLNNALCIIKPYFSDGENLKLRAAANEYMDFLKASDFYLTHGDLHFENLIVDDYNNLVGIIDFGNVEFYVPEIEFMWIKITDPNFKNDNIIFNSMVENYTGNLDFEKVNLVRLVGAIRFFKHTETIYQGMKESQLAFIKKLLTFHRHSEKSNCAASPTDCSNFSCVPQKT